MCVKEPYFARISKNTNTKNIKQQNSNNTLETYFYYQTNALIKASTRPQKQEKRIFKKLFKKCHNSCVDKVVITELTSLFSLK